MIAWSKKYGIVGDLLKPGAENVIRFGQTRAVEGTLRDDKGQPAAGVNISVRLFYPPRNPDADEQFSNFFFLPSALSREYSARTDAKGLWQIGGLPKNVYVEVELVDPKYLTASRPFEPDGEDHGPFGNSFVAVRAGQITGRVLDETGAPVTDMNVFALAQTNQKESRRMGGFAKTDAEGHFTISSLAAGDYNVANAAPTYMRRQTKDEIPHADAKKRVAKAIEDVRVEATKTTNAGDLNLIAPAFVKGKVLDRDSGAPIKGAYVAAYNAATPRSGENFPLAQTDSEGNFEIALVPGPAALYVMGREFYMR